MKVYQETGSWPGFKKATDSGNKSTAAWDGLMKSVEIKQKEKLFISSKVNRKNSFT